MLRTKLVSITIVTFLMTSIWTLPTVFAGHCKGPHADFPECPPPPPDIHDELLDDHDELAAVPWSEIINVDRFISVLNNEGILDRETGLVWEKTPNNALADAATSFATCHRKMVGNRYGWRLPTITELGSLVDPSQSSPALPAGHPFIGVASAAADHYYATNPTEIRSVFLTVTFNSNGAVDTNQGSSNPRPSWCVRGH